MYAIINDNGQQHMVRKGESLLVDRKHLNEGDEIRFDKVLCLDGKTGAPFVDGAAVSAIVRGEIKGKKIYVEKFKRRKKYRRRNGHRQKYTRVEITDIIS